VDDVRDVDGRPGTERHVGYGRRRTHRLIIRHQLAERSWPCRPLLTSSYCCANDDGNQADGERIVGMGGGTGEIENLKVAVGMPRPLGRGLALGLLEVRGTSPSAACY
jgi:hypothetical protein